VAPPVTPDHLMPVRHRDRYLDDVLPLPVNVSRRCIQEDDANG
jgi:hypothetical protein